MQNLDMETPTVNYMFIARHKKDSGWDAVVSSSLADHNAKIDDVKARDQHDFLIDYRHPRSISRGGVVWI